MMLELVPDAIKSCPQWLLWKPVWLPDKNKMTKIPLSAVTGGRASVRAPHEWSDFASCVDVFTKHGEDQQLGGLGFVFGYGSGVAGLDLDSVLDANGNVQNYNAVEVARRFDSYTEVSPSGTGLHTLFKANVPDGRRSKGYELYGEGRYFTVTGKPFFNLPLNERQFAADSLRDFMDAERAKTTAVTVDWSVQPKYTNEQIWHYCTQAANGEKFYRLFQGEYHSMYGSQSEADFALIDILAHWSDSPQQVQLMFMGSKLAERDKARERPKYVQEMVSRSFDRKVPLVAIPPMPVVTVQKVAPTPEHVTADDAENEAQKLHDPFTMPPGEGMVGHVATYIFNQSIYPMKEAALLASLALFAGICGRQYQYKGKGLNLYLMLLANTGSGKEAMSTGIGSIMEAICDPPQDVNAQPTTNIESVGLPSARAFRGPAKLTGKGLMTTLSKCDPLSMFSILNEFADTMRQMADSKNGNQGIADLKTALLDLYMKSTQGNSYAGHVTADKDTTIKAFHSPAFTFLAECTPGKLYSYLNEDLITDGMLPRMVIFESDHFGAYNEHFASYAKVPKFIEHHMRSQCKLVLDLKIHNDARIAVQETPEAATRSEEFRRYARSRLEARGTDDGTRELWNRAHLNAERIAALIAIGCNPTTPCVTAEQIDWAARIIVRQIVLLVGKFKRGETGEVSQDDNRQLEDIRNIIANFMALNPTSMPKSANDTGAVAARMAGAIPFRFMQQRTANMASFRHDKRGPTAALRVVLDTLVKTGELVPVRLETHSATFYKVNS